MLVVFKATYFKKKMEFIENYVGKSYITNN